MAWPRLLAASRRLLAAPSPPPPAAGKAKEGPRPRPPVGACGRESLMENLEKRTAWDSFYCQRPAQPFRHFDWFLGYAALRETLAQLLREVRGEGLQRVLDIGCGTSELGPRLYCESSVPLHVSCLDFSPVAIAVMRAQCVTLPPPRNPASQLHFLQADATELSTVERATFDLVLDKGTLDALLRAKDGGGAARRALAECLRVMRASGAMLQVSDEDPDARMLWLESLRRVNVTTLELGADRGIKYFAYIIKHSD
uniref:citrate synthase-lysine N-methyltransferase CSKMT, mitochondrial isoform X4 n=1 Tax=Pristiophorus japonicus TaxID=55135 RepID=UPI00398F7D8B